MNNITVTKVTSFKEFEQACASTIGKEHIKTHDIGALFTKLLRAEHSPTRTQMYMVAFTGLKTSASVHLVRHKIGVEHFVQSMREDNPRVKEKANRDTPVLHTLLANAQALVNMSVDRLCFKADAYTRKVWESLVEKTWEADPYLAPMLVPKCVYRGGRCAEIKTCGLIDSMWNKYNGDNYWDGCAAIK